MDDFFYEKAHFTINNFKFCDAEGVIENFSTKVPTKDTLLRQI